MARTTITTERLFPSGALLLSTIHEGQYIKQQYQGYTQAQAKREFKEHLTSLSGQKQVNKRKATLKHGNIKALRALCMAGLMVMLPTINL